MFSLFSTRPALVTDDRRRRHLPRLLLSLWLLLSLSISCHAAEKTTLLLLGDSLSAGYGLNPGESWVDLLTQDLANRTPPITLINDSISGDTTAGGAARLPDSLRRQRPDWVIIELGGNDGLRGSPLPAMRANLIKMIHQTRQQNATPILFGMQLPPNYGHRYTTAFIRTFQTVSTETDTLLLPLFIAGIEDDPEMFQADRIHPNARAQPIIMRNVREFLLGVGVL